MARITTPLLRRFTMFVLLFLGVSFIVTYYGSGYKHPPCCDTAITMSRAQWIAQTKELNPLSPYNPSTGARLYQGPISTEIVGHLLLAGVYMLLPMAVGSLLFAKWYFAVLFGLSAIPVFFVMKELLRSVPLSAVLMVFTYVAFWHGYMFWGGHIAQILGVGLFAIGILYLLRLTEEKLTWAGTAKILLVVGLLFFTHVLTFLLYFILAVGVYIHLILVRGTRRSKYILALSLGIAPLIFLIYFIRGPEGSSLLPNFAVVPDEHKLFSTIQTTLGHPLLLVLAALGLLGFVLANNIVMGGWLMTIILLTQSATFGSPFYPTRFDEFLAFPLMILVGQGIIMLQRQLRGQLYRQIPILAALILFLPYALSEQTDLRQCYVRNCLSLHPTQVTDNDLQAFAWLKTHTTDLDRITGFAQFAYFIPIISGRKTEIAEDAKRQIFTEPKSSERSAVAKNFGITYIVWDDIFDQYNGHILGAEDFQERPLQDQKYFQQVATFGGARIYYVR